MLNTCKGGLYMAGDGGGTPSRPLGRPAGGGTAAAAAVAAAITPTPAAKRQLRLPRSMEPPPTNAPRRALAEPVTATADGSPTRARTGPSRVFTGGERAGGDQGCREIYNRSAGVGVTMRVVRKDPKRMATCRVSGRVDGGQRGSCRAAERGRTRR